ncbi:MAG: YibE/F family protein [Erysipelotrichales bacterium]|nr:YibE/F family protein [Erysipelotrichales bacterium]MBQ1386819.1 YibE/F family protein [Erysipelotrichales bacterium]MBQ5542155.1 YibE/F family protein [Erysipelotrichales bacterium]
MNKFRQFLSQNRNTLIALLICAVLFIAAYAFVKPEKKSEEEMYGDSATYDEGKVTQVLTDSTFEDPSADNAWRGEQTLIVEMLTGKYKGKSLQTGNYVGPLYGVPLKAGDTCTVVVSTFSDGQIRATVYEYSRTVPLLIVAALFILATVLVGGKNGVKSLVGLAVTVLTLFCILLPALLKGAPTLLSTFLTGIYVSLVTLLILGGAEKKTLCAFLGTAAGMTLAFLFAVLAQSILRIDGMRLTDVEPLLQLRQTGTPIGLRGLLSAGVIISSLGAVMDVAMSLSSSLKEVHEANTDFTFKDLFRSGMNIGRDMVGTMTNTLILAFLGSGLVLILYISSLHLRTYQLLSSSYVAIETVSGISCSIGVILSVPITAFIASRMYGKR